VSRSDPVVLSPPRLTSERKRRGQPRRHILKHEGLDLAEVKVKSLDGLVDLRGNPCSSEVHVLKALQDGQGQAGIMGERFWNHLAKEQPDQFSGLKTLWISRPFSHCVFTTSKDFDRGLADRFSEMMFAMDPNDPATAENIHLEGTRKWVAGSPDGFQELVKTLREEPESCGSAGSNAP
jgi:phosphonate transport system substrate-binding protein